MLAMQPRLTPRFAVARPDRSQAQDAPTSRFLHQGSGASGTVAAPSRLTAITGDGIPERPSPYPNGPAGAKGPITTFREMISRNNPFQEPNPNYGSAHYIRQFYPNVIGMMDHGVPVAATPNWTTNSVPEATVPKSPIPVSHKRIVQTLALPYNQCMRSIYYPRLASKPPQAVRRYQTDTMGAQKSPYISRLTRYRTSRSYGQSTPVLEIS